MSLIRGLKVDTQRPLDEVRVVKNIASISTLGTDNYLAYLYYKNLVVHCLEENVYYQWRVPKDEDEVGLLPSNFVYPSGIIEYGMDYSGLVFNFFLEPNLNNIAIANLGTGASIYKDFTLVANTKTFNLKKLKSTGGTVTITELANEINFEVDIDVNITAGANIVVTVPTPNNFVIEATLPTPSAPTELVDGDTTTVSGNGSVSTPYKVEVVNLQKVIDSFPYTLSDTDDKYTIFIDNNTYDGIINVPDTLPDNFSVAFIQKGTGDVTITPTGTSVINTAIGYKIKGQYYWALLEKELNTVTYYLIGNTKI